MKFFSKGLMLMGLLSVFNFGCSSKTELKTIKYRGGIVNFQIPASWKEEYEDEGGGTFYEDSSDSGTLRLNIITFKAPKLVNQEVALEGLRTGDLQKKTITKLGKSNAISKYSQSAEEDGQRLHMIYWEIANPVPPNHVRIAIFSYTILEEQKNDSKFIKEIELLDTCLRKLHFSKILGK